MDTTDLFDAFRQEVDDLEDPHLWSESEVFTFMDEAQKMFCRKTEGIEDARTVSVCQLSIAPATEWYAKSPLILKVRSASRSDNGREVEVLTPENAARAGVRFGAGNTSPVRVLVDGQSKGFFRAWPMPNETVTIQLTVFRLPLVPITDVGGQQFEIDEQHHRSLLMWMKHLAYAKQDADTHDGKASEQFANQFLAYCAAARVEQERARRQTGTVMYGGI